MIDKIFKINKNGYIALEQNQKFNMQSKTDKKVNYLEQINCKTIFQLNKNLKNIVLKFL